MARRRQEIDDLTSDAPPVALEDDAKRSPLGFASTEPFPSPQARAAQLRSQYGPYGYNNAGAAPPLSGYFSGDEWRPADAPHRIPDIQVMLIQAGLLDEKDARPGVWDAAAAAAYREVLSLANRQGRSAQSVLMELASNPTLGQLEEEAGGTARAPLTVQLTNPADLRESFRRTYQDRVGKNPTPGALDAFVRTFQSMERGAQESLYNTAEGGGTVTGPPSPATAALEALRGSPEDAAEEHAYQTIARQQEFFSMLNSPVQT